MIKQFRTQRPGLWLLLCAGCGMIVVTLVIMAAVQGYDEFSQYPLVPAQSMREQTKTINANDVEYLSFSYPSPFPIMAPQKIADRKAIATFVNALHHAYTGTGPETDHQLSQMEIHFKKVNGSQRQPETLDYNPSSPSDCFGNEFYQALQDYNIKVHP